MRRLRKLQKKQQEAEEKDKEKKRQEEGEESEEGEEGEEKVDEQNNKKKIADIAAENRVFEDDISFTPTGVVIMRPKKEKQDEHKLMRDIVYGTRLSIFDENNDKVIEEPKQPFFEYEEPKINYWTEHGDNISAGYGNNLPNEDPDSYDNTWARYSKSTIKFKEDELMVFDDNKVSLSDRVFDTLRKPKLPKRSSLKKAFSLKRRSRVSTGTSLTLEPYSESEPVEEDNLGKKDEGKPEVSEPVSKVEDEPRDEENLDSPVNSNAEKEKNAKNLEDKIFPTDLLNVEPPHYSNDQVSSFLNKPYSVDGSDSFSNLPAPPSEFYDTVQPLDDLEDENVGQGNENVEQNPPKDGEDKNKEETKLPELPPRSYKNNKNVNNLTNKPLDLKNSSEENIGLAQPNKTEDAERADIEINELDNTSSVSSDKLKVQELKKLFEKNKTTDEKKQ